MAQTEDDLWCKYELITAVDITIGILVLIGVIDTGAAYSLLRQIYSIGLSIYGLSESKIWWRHKWCILISRWAAPETTWNLTIFALFSRLCFTKHTYSIMGGCLRVGRHTLGRKILVLFGGPKLVHFLKNYGEKKCCDEISWVVKQTSYEYFLEYVYRK